MAKIIPFPMRDERLREQREEASRWVVRLDAGVSELELRALHAWLNKDRAHVDALLEAAALWDRVDMLAGLAKTYPLKHFPPPPTRSSRQRYARLAIAALVAILAACLALALPSPLQQPWTPSGQEGLLGSPAAQPP